MSITEVAVTQQFDPVLLAVLSNRLDSIVREMSDTLLRSGRSAVINSARDFSCALVSGDHQLLATAEGLPVHVFGSHIQAQFMAELHPEFRPGDAFLHNDPYMGNTHSADHTILVPVFHEGEHLFTACAKAHQADCGNAQPTTYMAYAKDVYEEGAPVFPCVLTQRDYEDVDDVIRMCRARIRVPDQWYGDYLAMVGAARVAERRLTELAAKYGNDVIRDFVSVWFDYSERRMDAAIRTLPAGRFTGYGAHDPFPGLPDGVPLKVDIDVDAAAGRVEIDLRDNIDCVPAGLNQSEATAINNVITGVLNSLHHDIPHNSGSFRRVTVRLRENCVVGIPVHPTSTSVATTNIADRLVNITQAAFADYAPEYGLAEGAMGNPPACGVISGHDPRHGDAPFVNQLILGSSGGPGTPTQDGWVTYGIPVTAGLMYRDSVEIDELKYPLLVEEQRILQDTEGAGRRRGAPGSRTVFGPLRSEMTIIYNIDGHHQPPRGVRGGADSIASSAQKRGSDGAVVELDTVGRVDLVEGERIISIASGGGGYGDPFDRDAERVLRDVLERWITTERARDVYGVALIEDAEGDLVVDAGSTAALRKRVAGHAGGTAAHV